MSPFPPHTTDSHSPLSSGRVSIRTCHASPAKISTHKTLSTFKVRHTVLYTYQIVSAAADSGAQFSCVYGYDCTGDCSRENEIHRIQADRSAIQLTQARALYARTPCLMDARKGCVYTRLCASDFSPSLAYKSNCRSDRHNKSHRGSRTGWTRGVCFARVFEDGFQVCDTRFGAWGSGCAGGRS